MFRYIVEDNFFEAEDLIKIKSVIDSHEKLRDLNDDNSIIINLNKDFGNYLIHKYENKMINYLNELNPKKNALYDYAEISITISGKNFNYPIHNDSLTKILSGVIYLWPEINIGTIIYDDNKKNPKEIKWKVNRAFVFSRKDKGSWHSYGSDGVTTRCAAIFTLRTKKLDRALIIDRGFIIFLIKKIRSFFIKDI
jgi:hypothetical protein